MNLKNGQDMNLAAITQETPKTENLLDALNVAIALGAKIAAPIGSFFYDVDYFDNDNVNGGKRQWSLGHYQSIEAAEAALVNWIIDEWTESGNTPWRVQSSMLASQELKDKMKAIRESESPPMAYLESHTDSQIIDWYFAQSSDGYKINKRKIAAHPEPMLGFRRKKS